jgi:hypothetical protein
MIINNKVVDQKSIAIEGIDMADYPDFCDAYVSEASFVDGTPLTDAELEKLTEDHGNELAHESMF